MKKITFTIIALLLLSMACTLTSPSSQNHLAMEESREPEATETQSKSTPEGRPTILSQSPSATPYPNCEVSATYLNVRACQGIECPAIGHLKQGSNVVILADEDNWFQIALADRNTGWINAAYCTEILP
jgi:uncharacterized protein YgiM (DUF1202 family)